VSIRTAVPVINDLGVSVRDVFARVTRYPLEVLDPTAGLEEELGIDSVKLGEVFAVLREQYGLPEKMDIPRESLKTIDGIVNALQDYLANGAGSVAVTAKTSNGHEGNGNGFAGVAAIQEIFAQVTRYPLEVLDPNSALEEDLGIDSVKLGEVFAVLREKYHLPEKLDIPREKFKTIGAITEALHDYLAGVDVVKSEPASAPAQVEGPVARPEQGNGFKDLTSVQASVLEIFAQVTRYPLEVLDPAAGLEEDLGIDSVKLGEVFAVMREKYSLPEQLDIPREKFRSIGSISEALYEYIANSAATHVSSNGDGAGGSSTEAPAAFLQPTTVDYSKTDSFRATTSTAESQAAALYAPEAPVSKPFSGKVLFVSGSGRGLGKDIAVYLAQLGASVVINSFHSRAKGDETAEEIRDAGGDAIHSWGSMANPEHVNRVFDEIETHYGHLDFFIGNASNGMLARLEDITVEHWEKAYRTNVIGLHQSALRAVQLMRRRGGGKIITLSSPAAHGYVDYFGCMGTVKAAVESLTRSMAIEFAPYNIQVNCVSPGPVYGELLKKWPESDRLVRQWETNTAYGRLCEARDVSHFIAYLLSEPVKLFTGSVLVMDGGISSQGW
jgi:NAD(P)-dependent dehydrogenase (short-subunit alcohol dehydrogenase family)/acyl carrier protein